MGRDETSRDIGRIVDALTGDPAWRAWLWAGAILDIAGHSARNTLEYNPESGRVLTSGHTAPESTRSYDY